MVSIVIGDGLYSGQKKAGAPVARAPPRASPLAALSLLARGEDHVLERLVRAAGGGEAAVVDRGDRDRVPVGDFDVGHQDDAAGGDVRVGDAQVAAGREHVGAGGHGDLHAVVVSRGALRAGRTHGTHRPGGALVALQTLGSVRALVALEALLSVVALLALEALGSVVALVALQ